MPVTVCEISSFQCFRSFHGFRVSLPIGELGGKSGNTILERVETGPLERHGE